MPADCPLGVSSSKSTGLGLTVTFSAAPRMLLSIVTWKNSQSEHCVASWPSRETKVTLGLGTNSGGGLALLEALESTVGESDTISLVADAMDDSSVLCLKKGETDSKFADWDGDGATPLERERAELLKGVATFVGEASGVALLTGEAVREREEIGRAHV